MNRLNAVLLLAVVFSGLWLVRTAYEARRLFTEVHRADVEAQRLQGEHKRLEAERELQATNQRVDATARQKLRMASATPAITLYENASGLLPAPQAAPAAGTVPGARP